MNTNRAAYRRFEMIWITGALILTGLPAHAQAPGKTPGKPLTEADIERIVGEYIAGHGDAIIQAVGKYHERERTAQSERAREAIQTRQSDLLSDAGSPVLGPAQAGSDTVTVVEFFDYRCGYCKRVAPAISKILADNPKVRVVMKEFPILGPESDMAARAALAAARQAGYAKFHEALMSSTEALNMESIEKLARKLNLDVARLKTDMDSADVQQAIQRNRELATAVGVNSTPSFVVGSQLVAGGMDAAALQALVDKTRTQRKSE